VVQQSDVDITVAADPTAARKARRALAERRLVDSEREPALLLLVSELVTNSVRHAGLTEAERIRLRARRQDHQCAYVEVCDGGRSGRIPNKREPSLDALEPGGLGLMLVDEMADRWGIERGDDETCVWFELACA
jgi:anti-sigma regulatory factor (Ser/Thr protein kinase)